MLKGNLSTTCASLLPFSQLSLWEIDNMCASWVTRNIPSQDWMDALLPISWFLGWDFTQVSVEEKNLTDTRVVRVLSSTTILLLFLQLKEPVVGNYRVPVASSTLSGSLQSWVYNSSQDMKKLFESLVSLEAAASKDNLAFDGFKSFPNLSTKWHRILETFFTAS